MKFPNCRIELLIGTFLILLISYSCNNKTAGRYIGINETKNDEIVLDLSPDYSFKMNLFTNGNFNEPQEALLGTWENEGNQLKLKTNDNTVIYERQIESITTAGRKITLETFVFKTCVKDFFAFNFDFFKDRNSKKEE